MLNHSTIYKLIAQNSSSFLAKRYCDETFAQDIVEEYYNLERMMDNRTNFFDYEAFGRKLLVYDYTISANGNVFRNI